MAIAHVTTFEGGQKAISVGVDGLAHLFFDRQPTPEMITAIASSGAFVTSTLVTLSTAFGNSAATYTPARRFGLTDRGRIAPGVRADLLLVDGDPTINISDTLSILGVWRGGIRLSTH
jgi:imidazolonepropionase-like amidohydrolase